MAKNRVFVSFDRDHDESLESHSQGQAKSDDSPFAFIDASLLWGYSAKPCAKPTAAKSTDKIYKWDLEILSPLIADER